MLFLYVSVYCHRVTTQLQLIKIYIYIYLRTDIKQILTHASSIRNNVLHDLTFIEMLVARFMGTGGFLIRCPNDHTK